MIDYDVLARALKYYTGLGYTSLEVPWLVSEEINNLTKPSWAASYDVIKAGRKKAFIGSGEQGFLYLIAKGYLPPGKYVTCTPCMRNDNFDETHVKYFMKVELIQFGWKTDDDDAVAEHLMEDAFEFFSQELTTDRHLNRVATDDGLDIEFYTDELGSYGIRECKLVKWAYGTGVAEPRFSRLRDYYNEWDHSGNASPKED